MYLDFTAQGGTPKKVTPNLEKKLWGVEGLKAQGLGLRARAVGVAKGDFSNLTLNTSILYYDVL